MIIRLKKCLAPGCEQQAHQWEFEDFTAQEMRKVQKQIGMEVPEFLQHVQEGGMTAAAMDAMILLVVFMHRRDGVIVAFDDMDFHLQDLEFADPDAPVEDAEKPTEPETTSPRREEPPVSSSTSGPEPAAESTPKSSPTPEPSGGTSGSPS